MNQEEKKDPGIREIDAEELGTVAGGWEYDGSRTWLKGHDIVCPYCGSNSREDIDPKYTTQSSVQFKCKICNRNFTYSYQSRQIFRFDDHGHGI